MNKGPTWLTILKDLICTAIGTAGMLRMILTNEVNTQLLIVYLVLLGVAPLSNFPGLVRSLSDSQQQPSQSTSSPSDSSHSDSS